MEPDIKLSDYDVRILLDWTICTATFGENHAKMPPALRNLLACRAALRKLLAASDDVAFIELPAEREIKVWLEAKRVAREALGETPEGAPE